LSCHEQHSFKKQLFLFLCSAVIIRFVNLVLKCSEQGLNLCLKPENGTAAVPFQPVPHEELKMKRLSLAVLLFCFTVSAIPLKDSVWVEPQKPTDTDSLTFHLFNIDPCCCAVYSDNTAGVADTTILLSYTIDVEPCTRCLCLVPGSWTEFGHGPAPAGTYAVYKAESPYCAPGDPCPRGPVVLQRVGEVVIVPAQVPAIDRKGNTCRKTAGSGADVNVRAGKSGIVVDNASAGPVGVSLFFIDGKRIAMPERAARIMPGTHEIESREHLLSARAIVVRIETASGTRAGRVVVLW
jgi:hypothetical protein